MKTILITGGSEGIGYSFAKAFARKNNRIILCARNKDKLAKAAESLFPAEVRTISLDLSEKGSPGKLADMCKEEEIDILINNAGIGYTGSSLLQSTENLEKMISLNITAVLLLTRIFAEKMKQKGSGTIINVASTGAFQPGPYIASYYASKAAVLSYTEALHEELKKDNVQIYCLCPGPVATDFYAKSGGKIPALAQNADEVVKYTLSHLHGKCVIIPGFANRLARIVPSSLRMHAVKKMKMNKLKKKK